MYSKLQYISQGNTAEEQFKNISAALEAGCNWIQLRFKNSSHIEFLKLAIRVKSLCKIHNAVLIVNDNISVAKEIDADGIHLGLTDSPIAEARKNLGEKIIIGGTANTLNDVLQRINEKCNYVGLGPFRFTNTKQNLSPVLGLEGYDSIMKELHAKEIKIPIYAIGGIGADDVEEIISTGVYGVAVSGVITNHENKKELIKQFNNSLHELV